jgi:hypothetical protein
MKYDEMNEKQRDALKNMFLTVLNVKSQEEQLYTQQFFRLLVLGNGSGIILLASFMGALVHKSESIHLLKRPLLMFFIGALLAAFVYVPLVLVSSQATDYMFRQIQEFFLNKRALEQITGYSFSRRGIIIVLVLLIGSLGFFSAGVFLCISALGKMT